MQQLATETDRNNPYINCAECLLLKLLVVLLVHSVGGVV